MQSKGTKRVRIAAIVALMGLIIGLGVLPVWSRQTPQEWFQQGNKMWEQQSYSEAAAAYQKAISGDAKFAQNPEITLRLVIALIRAKEWDKAIVAADAYVLTHKGTIWEARGLVWRGRLYHTVEHQGYRIGKKETRGYNTPPSEGKNTPIFVNFTVEDARKTYDSLFRAKALYEKFRDAKTSPANELLTEEIELNFDLAHLLQNRNDLSRYNTRAVDWTIDLKEPFDPLAPSPKQVMYLYEQIIAFDANRNGDHHDTVLATVGKATYILILRRDRLYSYPLIRSNSRTSGMGWRQDYRRPIPNYVPYREIDPIRLLENVLAQYPNDRDADRLTYLIALWTEQKNDMLNALSRYYAFLQKYPNSRWVSDAKGRIQQILNPELNVSTQTMNRVGTRPNISISARNLSQVRLVAYRVYLEDVWGKPFTDAEGKTVYYSLDLNRFAGIGEVPHRREKVAEWTVTMNDTGKHEHTNANTPLPLDTLGAYLIEAVPVGKETVKATTMAIVSDFHIIQKIDKDASLVYAGDATTGSPIANVKIATLTLKSDNSWRDVEFRDGTTDMAGTVRIVLPLRVGETENTISRQRVTQVFAMAGANRYAVTGVDTFHQEIPVGQARFRAYVYTDRPLYRPAQTVNFRIALSDGIPGSYRTAKDKTKVRVTINSPKGNVYDKELTLDAYGSASDKLDLPKGADLGEYTIGVLEIEIDKTNPRTLGGGSFVVEEYKKPEFAVAVQPEKSQVRVGETMRVTIGAKFFFGAPVVGAKVHYRVFRTPATYPLFFSPKVDWYDSPTNYDNGNYAFSYATYRTVEPQYDLSYFGNTAYREGDLTTNAKGEAIVTFPTDPPKPPKGWNLPPNYKPDQNFTITAEVVDDSRRQVTGVGAAKATAAQFKAQLQLDRRFLLADDVLKIEARTIDANGKPFAANGYVSFYKQIPAIPEQRVFDPRIGKEVVTVPYVPAREEKIETLFLPTTVEKNGLGTLYWRPMMTGDFRIQYDAKDAYGNSIIAMSSVLVYGTDFDTRLNKDDNRFHITPEYADYRPGDTARVLIITPKPDSYVLLTEQSVSTIRRYRTVFVPGRSTVVSVNIGKDNLPNTELTVSMLRDGTVYHTQVAVGVIAERQVLNLAVTADKKEYKPGEKATFRIRATDADGKPVRGQFSLSVVDQALLAIQPDMTMDIRRFFYGYTLPASASFSNSVYYNTGAFNKSALQTYYETHDLWYPEGISWLRDRLLQRQQQLPPYVENTILNYDVAKDFYSQNGQFGRMSSTGGFGGGSMGMMGGSMGGRGGGGVFDDPTTTGELMSETKSSRSRDEVYNRPQPGAPGSLLPSGLELFAYDADGSLLIREERDQKPGGSAPNYVEAVVRKLFADSAYWVPNVETDADGYATVTFDFPDNITEWKVISRGLTADVKVGYGDTTTTVKKNLMARLQAPRFFVERDQVTISANVHNYLDAAKQTRIELVVDEHLAFGTGANNTAVRTISLDKNGEQRIDWIVDIKTPGKTKIKVIAQTDTESDAAELEFPVLVHGVEKFIVQSGVMRNGGTTTLTLDLPEMRRKGASLLNVQVSPSLASVMLDALPYLEDYPYGCIEQTISRFMPTVLVARTLKDAGIDLETLGKRLKALEEQRANIPPQQIYENSGYTYPKGKPGVLQASDLAARISYSTQRGNAPLFNTTTLNSMVNEGLERITRLQKPSGGWGWWEGSPVEDYYLTAFVTEGLIHARRADVAVNQEMLNKAMSFLNARLAGTDDLHLRAYMTYVVGLEYAMRNATPPNEFAESLRFLYERRDRLNAYGKAILCLALKSGNSNDLAQIVLQNLVTLAKFDRDRGTVHWEGDPTYYWRWYNDRTETTAMVLRALVAVGGNAQLEPVNGAQKDQTGLAPMAVRWLTDNRRGGMWTATRQTSNAIQALTAYIQAQKELAPDYTVTLDLDGKVQKTFKITKENALLFDTRFLVGDEVFTSGAQKLTITMQGTGTLYYNAYLKYFDMQEPIKGVANAIGVERKYYKLAPTQKKDKKGQTTTTYERLPLTDGAMLTSGDQIEVELFLKSDNEYDYLVFEDMKPAGCEAVETRSGTAYGDGLCTNFELRDEKVAFFIDHLPQGTRRITYKLRAEIPGAFHALPTNGYAMYTPDIRALSDEMRLSIQDAPPIVEKKTRK